MTHYMSRLLKNTHLLGYAYPSSVQRTDKYASFLRISRALHLDFFEQPEKCVWVMGIVPSLLVLILFPEHQRLSEAPGSDTGFALLCWQGIRPVPVHEAVCAAR